MASILLEFSVVNPIGRTLFFTLNPVFNKKLLNTNQNYEKLPIMYRNLLDLDSVDIVSASLILS